MQVEMEASSIDVPLDAERSNIISTLVKRDRAAYFRVESICPRLIAGAVTVVAKERQKCVHVIFVICYLVLHSHSLKGDLVRKR